MERVLALTGLMVRENDEARTWEETGGHLTLAWPCRLVVGAISPTILIVDETLLSTTTDSNSDPGTV